MDVLCFLLMLLHLLIMASWIECILNGCCFSHHICLIFCVEHFCMCCWFHFFLSFFVFKFGNWDDKNFTSFDFYCIVFYLVLTDFIILFRFDFASNAQKCILTLCVCTLFVQTTSIGLSTFQLGLMYRPFCLINWDSLFKNVYKLLSYQIQRFALPEAQKWSMSN